MLMHHHTLLSSPPNCPLSTQGRIQSALEILRQAAEYALQTDSDRWEFAVEMEELRAAGLNTSDFRWLQRQGLVEHRKEITREEEDRRSFISVGELCFPPGTCFVLAGNFLEGPLMAGDGLEHHVNCGVSPQLQSAAAAPVWRNDIRALIFRGRIVKRFRWPAVNQEAILNAFEEDGWPERIDDPIPPQIGQEPKRRLADTIKCLNRKHMHHLLHFRGDGTGAGVIWEPSGI